MIHEYDGRKIAQALDVIAEKQSTLRDQFAMAALTGFCANPTSKDMEGGSFFAKIAYKCADAMMEARKK